ncbi:MAG: hypothetical protein JW910_09465, partial [Anaerolineae bacterium]|nr:hypothetical protein [Anaerolineae bacterium]
VTVLAVVFTSPACLFYALPGLAMTDRYPASLWFAVVFALLPLFFTRRQLGAAVRAFDRLRGESAGVADVRR